MDKPLYFCDLNNSQDWATKEAMKRAECKTASAAVDGIEHGRTLTTQEGSWPPETANR